MSRSTILAHKHTLCEAFAGFFRALATEQFFEVQQWLHPDLEKLVYAQCERLGETSFLRSLKHGLGSAAQRVRLGSSQAEGARQIKTELLAPSGVQAGSVRFVLSPDGWRIYSLEVFTNGGRPVGQAPTPIQVSRAQPAAPKRKSKLPRMLSNKWFSSSGSSG